MNRPPVRAIVWDFDNTLVDTGARNRSVTRRIVWRITGLPPDDFAPLRTQEAYDRALHATQDWRELYAVHFGMSEPEILAAGRLWTRYQATDETPTRWFPKVADALLGLEAFPHGIVSLNTRGNIESTLERHGLRSSFRTVVGCGDVPADRLKPNPEGLMRCVASLIGTRPGTVVYVGDHPIDAECADNANRRYERQGTPVNVVSVAAAYGSTAGDAKWAVPAGFEASCPMDVVRIVESLSG